MTQAEKVEYIIDRSCTYFGITRDEIKPRMKPKSELVTARRFVIKTLSDHTVLSFQRIADLLHFKTHSNITFHLAAINNDLSNETYGSDKIKRLYKEYLDYLNL